MHDSSPPTLLDRLTRFDKPDEEPTSTSYRGGAASLPVLNDLISQSNPESVHLRPLAGHDGDLYKPTDFAITTVDVPDRLDLREVRDQAEEEYKRPGLFSFDRYLLGLWVRRIVLLTFLGLIGFWAYRTALPLRDELSPDRISQRLSARTGLKVQVADVTYRATPSPRVVLLGVRVADDLRFDEIALKVNWRETWNALVGGAWSLGEATISPIRLTQDQAWSLLNQATGWSKALPDALSALRFESIEIADVPLLKGRYELTLRRGVSGKFGPVLINETGADSLFKLSLKSEPAADGSARLAFQFDAHEWTPPFGPSVKWNEASATGYFTPKFFEIESYLLSGAYGVLRGSLYAVSDTEWAVTGFSRGTGLDIESLVAATAKVARSPSGEKADAAPIPFAGTASVDLALVGRGTSLNEAIDSGIAAGPIQVRWATIRGVNLGYAATHGGSERGLSGGLTRFSDFDAMLLASSASFAFKDIVARAGAMTTRGEVTLDNENVLKGSLRVDLGATRVQAPINLKVRGPLLTPQFVR